MSREWGKSLDSRQSSGDGRPQGFGDRLLVRGRSSHSPYLQFPWFPWSRWLVSVMKASDSLWIWSLCSWHACKCLRRVGPQAVPWGGMWKVSGKRGEGSKGNDCRRETLFPVNVGPASALHPCVSCKHPETEVPPGNSFHSQSIFMFDHNAIEFNSSL